MFAIKNLVLKAGSCLARVFLADLYNSGYFNEKGDTLSHPVGRTLI